jgi:hypothetical protein
LRGDHELQMFENEMLKKTFAFKRDEVCGQLGYYEYLTTDLHGRPAYHLLSSEK